MGAISVVARVASSGLSKNDHCITVLETLLAGDSWCVGASEAKKAPNHEVFVRFSFADEILVSENQLSMGKILANQRRKRRFQSKRLSPGTSIVGF